MEGTEGGRERKEGGREEGAKEGEKEGGRDEDCGWLISLLVMQKHHLQHDTRKELCR